MFCRNCGTQLPDIAKFCKKCGTQVKSSPTPPVEEEPKREATLPVTVVTPQPAPVVEQTPLPKVEVMQTPVVEQTPPVQEITESTPIPVEPEPVSITPEPISEPEPIPKTISDPIPEPFIEPEPPAVAPVIAEIIPATEPPKDETIQIPPVVEAPVVVNSVSVAVTEEMSVEPIVTATEASSKTTIPIVSEIPSLLHTTVSRAKMINWKNRRVLIPCGILCILLAVFLLLPGENTDTPSANGGESSSGGLLDSIVNGIGSNSIPSCVVDTSDEYGYWVLDENYIPPCLLLTDKETQYIIEKTSESYLYLSENTEDYANILSDSAKKTITDHIRFLYAAYGYELHFITMSSKHPDGTVEGEYVRNSSFVLNSGSGSRGGDLTITLVQDEGAYYLFPGNDHYIYTSDGFTTLCDKHLTGKQTEEHILTFFDALLAYFKTNVALSYPVQIDELPTGLWYKFSDDRYVDPNKKLYIDKIEGNTITLHLDYNSVFMSAPEYHIVTEPITVTLDQVSMSGDPCTMFYFEDAYGYGYEVFIARSDCWIELSIAIVKKGESPEGYPIGFSLSRFYPENSLFY